MVFELIGLVTAAKGKEKQLEALLQKLTVGVEEHEPEVLRYLAYKVKGRRHSGGLQEYVIIERFMNQATFEAHIRLDYFKELSKKMEEQKLIATPIDGRQIVKVGGFDSRDRKAKL